MKRQPVVIYGAVVAALTAFLSVAGLTDRVSDDVVFWLGVALAVITAVGGVVVRGQVTPLADPTAKDGRRLVPTPPARVPEYATRRDLDATAEHRDRPGVS